MRFKRILFALYLFVSATANAGNGFAIKTIVLDAGHGGKDPGASGPGKTNEKDIALKVVLKLGDLIQKSFPDVNVIYTRKTDVFIELHERADIANSSKADLFMAIHCNSSTSPSTYGTSTYVLGLHRTEANLEVAKRENAVILMEDDRDKHYDFNPNSPEGHIMMSMKQNAFLDQSIDMASKIEGQFEATAKRKSLGVKQAGFYVIYKTAMPSLLSEIGFISNPDEEKFLNSAKGQDLIANSLFKAFKDYKFEIENSEGEQYAYEQARKKAQEDADAEASRKPGYKKEAVEMDVNGAPVPKETTVKKEEVITTTTTTTQPAAAAEQPVTTSSTAKPAATTTTATTTQATTITPVVTDPATVTLSGRKIRKPIENSSGGGTTVISVPAETTTVETTTKTEDTKKIKTDNSGATTSKEKKKETTKTEEVKQPEPVADNTVQEPAKQDDVKQAEPVTDNTVTSTPAKEPAKTKKEKENTKPEKTTVKTESKTVTKIEPAVVSDNVVVADNTPVKETKVEPVKPEPKPARTTTQEKPVAKTAPKPKATETSAESTPVATSSQGLVFKVQFIALRGTFKQYAKAAKMFPDISKEPIDNGIVRYYSCTVKSYAEAKKHLEEAINAGYADAFIVGVKNGNRLTPKQLESLKK